MRTANERELIKQPNKAMEEDFDYQGNSNQLALHFMAKHLSVMMVNIELRCPARAIGGNFGREAGVQYWGDVASHFKLLKATKLLGRLDFMYAQEVVDMMEDTFADQVNDPLTPLSLCNATMGMLERVRTLILSLLGATAKSGKGGGGKDDHEISRQLQSSQDKIRDSLMGVLKLKAATTPNGGEKRFGPNGLEYKKGGQDSAAPCNRIKNGKACFGACPFSHVGALPEQVNRPAAGGGPPVTPEKVRKHKKSKHSKD